MSALSLVLFWLCLETQAESAAPVSPAPWTHEVSGTFRSLFTTSRSLVTQESYADDLDRLRLKLAGARGYGFSYRDRSR